MNKVKINNQGTEWSFEVDEYKGSITAEEFALQHQVFAVNDNSDGKYSFVGTHENVLNAYLVYSKKN